jgi:hypothetical protein
MISGKDTCLYPPPSCDGCEKYELDTEKIYEPVQLIDKVDGFSLCAGPVYFSPSEDYWYGRRIKSDKNKLKKTETEI